MITLSLTTLFLALFLALCIIIKFDGVRFTDYNTPIRFVFLIYLLFFGITPFYWHLKGEYILFSNILIDYIPYAIVFYSIGSLSLLTGYLIFNKKSKYIIDTKTSYEEVDQLGKGLVLLIFTLNLLLVVIWAATTSYSVSALFLVNIFQDRVVNYDLQVSTGPLYLFVESLIVTSSLVILNRSISIPTKIIVSLFTFLIFISLGFRFRFILFIFIIMYSYLCLNNFELKRIRNVIIYMSAFCILLVSLSYLRNYVKQVNRGVNIELKADDRSFFDAMFSNTRNFYSFSSLIKYMDEGNGRYDYGETMFLNIAYRFIPSSFFPENTKPRPFGVEESAKSWGNYEGYYAGEAYSNFGEYYQAFGLFGIVFFNFVFGSIIAFISIKIRSDRSKLSINKFALLILVCSFFQMISRGYLPQYVLILMYMLIPILLVKIKNVRFGIS